MNTKIKTLREIGLFNGRALSYSKSIYREQNPNNVVYFNSGLFSLSEGLIWAGDLDLTKDSILLKEASDKLNETLYVLKESDCFDLNDKTSSDIIIKKSLWNTSLETPIK